MGKSGFLIDEVIALVGADETFEQFGLRFGRSEAGAFHLVIFFALPFAE